MTSPSVLDALSQIPPPIIVFAMMGSAYLWSRLRRQRDRAKLVDRMGLGTRDDLPADFPISYIDTFGKWTHSDVLYGQKDGDLLLAFEFTRYAHVLSRHRPIATVVARHMGRPTPPRKLMGRVHVRQFGAWRVAVVYTLFGFGYRRLSSAAIEELWELLA